MADEELHKTSATGSQGQQDWQADTKDEGSAEGTDATDKDDLALPMDKIEAVLNAKGSTASMTPQMRRVAQRQQENTRRVEESIKGTKANPSWFVPLFCTLMLLGLVWAVVYYLTSDYPIPNIGAWNLAIAIAIIMAGFLMTMRWR
ncbi:MAG: cell division protein CrgA [Bifidobacterium mongoliense]|nr:cell division protein CrgA [Bifidobacterium mongoliense]